MKKANVLQLTFIITGIAFGISALQDFFTTLLSLLIFAFNSNDLNNTLGLGMSMGILLSIGIKIFICWLLITQSGKLASFISKRAEFERGFSIISKADDLLYILLITVGIFLFLSNIVPLLTGIFDSFRNKSSSGMQNLFETAKAIDWTSNILDVILPLVFLMLARPIANYFAKNVNDEEITIEETDEEPNLLEPTQD